MSFDRYSREDREHFSYRDAGSTLTKQACEIENSLSNPVPVFVTTGSSSSFIVEYGEINVAQSVETTLLSYVVPASKTLRTHLISVCGENIGEFFIYINSVKKLTTRTNFGADLSRDIPIRFELVAGDLISIKAINPRTPTVKFNATLNGELF